MGPRKHIMCVGLCCLDVMCRVNSYPKEDTDQRCMAQWWQRGGNASNNSSVLGLLGANPTFFGTIADSYAKSFLLKDFAKCGVNTDQILCKDGEGPSSFVIINDSNGSRTIIHNNKKFPEVSVDDFAQVDLTPYQWIHFEGRNVANVIQMIDLVRQYNKNLPHNEMITISVEIEKGKPELEDLIPLADVVFVSKDFAAYKGYSNMAETLKQVQLLANRGAVIICPWGEYGATACQGDTMVHSPAFPPASVVDTLGAGDTFNAATIFALTHGTPLEDSIKFGCRVAGAKVGVIGWEPLRDLLKPGEMLLQNKATCDEHL